MSEYVQASGEKPRLVIVSGYGHDPFTPRGQRTSWLVEELGRRWDVELIAMDHKPSSAKPGGTGTRTASLRRLAARLLYSVLLDRSEPWAFRRFRRGLSGAEGAVLIVSPWSPAVYASRALAKAGIPYVVDAGDPWLLTFGDSRLPRAAWRIRRDEGFLWKRAAGAILTTEPQREALAEQFPGLEILVRPNGYRPVAPPPPAPPREPGVLRIAHYGILSATRIDPVPLLLELARSGRWREIELDQYGDDFGAGLDRLDGLVRIRHLEPVPWERVVAGAGAYDLALAIAYPFPKLLPSKAIEYSTLPIPRLALTNAIATDALRRFAAERGGWLAVSAGEADIAAKVADFLDRGWTPSELAPDPRDAWPAVAAEVATFASQLLDRRTRPTAEVTAR